MFTDSEKKQFSKNSLYLIEKLKICLEKRFSYLFSKDMEELFLAITYLDVRFKNFHFIVDPYIKDENLNIAKTYIRNYYKNNILPFISSISPLTPSNIENNESAENISSAQNTATPVSVGDNSMDIKKRPSYLNKIEDPRLMKASSIKVNTV